MSATLRRLSATLRLAADPAAQETQEWRAALARALDLAAKLEREGLPGREDPAILRGRLDAVLLERDRLLGVVQSLRKQVNHLELECAQRTARIQELELAEARRQQPELPLGGPPGEKFGAREIARIASPGWGWWIEPLGVVVVVSAGPKVITYRTLEGLVGGGPAHRMPRDQWIWYVDGARSVECVLYRRSE